MSITIPSRLFSSRLLLPAYFFLAFIINGTTYFAGRVPNDLRNVYVAAKMVLSGENPYDDARLKETWIRITREQRITGRDSASAPGLPVPLLYSPNGLCFYIPFSFIPWKIVVPLSRLLSLAAIVLLAFILCKANRVAGRSGPPLTIFLLALLALNGSSWIVTQANPAAFSALFIALSFYSFTKKRPALSGLWLGLAAIKVTLAFPMFLFMFAKKQHKTLVMAMLTASVPLLSFIGHGSFLDVCGSWPASAGDFTLRLFSLSPHDTSLWHGYDMWETAHVFLDYISPIGAIVSFYLHGSGLQHNQKILGYAVYGFYAVSALFLILLSRRNRIRDIPLIVLLFCLELLSNYHLLYDGIILIAFLGLIFNEYSPKQRIALILATSILFLPFNGAFIRLGIPKEFYLFLFNIPLMLIVVSVSTLYREFKGTGRFTCSSLP